MMVPTPDDQTLIIGTQLRSARESIGLSLEEAAASLNLSTAILAEWEDGTSEPPVEVLWQMSDLYRRAVDYFLKTTAAVSVQSAFRITNVHRLPDLEQRHRQVLIKFEELCRIQSELEGLLGVAEPPGVKKIREPISAPKLAEQQRVHFHLGTKPIGDLRSLLEKMGIKVFHLSVPDKKFAGFSWWHGEYGPGVLINSSDSQGRRNFTLAHELSHLLVDDRSVMCDMLMDADDERYANRFASNFLMPAEAMRKEQEQLPPSASEGDDMRLKRIASKYKVSIEALGHRLETLELLAAGTTDLKVRQWEEDQPTFRRSKTPAWRRRLGNRFSDLAFAGHAQGLISLSKVASLLEVDIRRAAALTNTSPE